MLQRLTSCRRCLSSSRRSAASRPLTPPLPFPVRLFYTSPPICLLFASWLSRCPCCHATADSASGLCLDLFFAIWLSQLPTPHLSRRCRLSSSSHLCLTTRCLRLSTHCHLITGCVVARRQCADIVAINAQSSLPSSRLRLSPSAIVAIGIPIWIWGSPYGKVDHHFHMRI